MEMLSKVEHQIQEQLSSDVRLMQNLTETKKLADLKKQFEETEESQNRIATNESSILKARDGFREIARRAATCFDVCQHLKEINHSYQTSFRQFLNIYDTSICHSERVSLKAVVDRLTYSHYLSVARTLHERDRFLYSLLLAIEVEDSYSRISTGEREYVISPSYCSMVMSATLRRVPSPMHRVQNTKKSFDWMLDEQFANLQILAINFDWFYDMFERMPRDGRETQWRTLCENDQPEKQPLPDKMDDVVTPMQRLMILRAVRADRIMHSSSLFINAVLDKRYLGDPAIDLPQMVRQSTPTTPIILQYIAESAIASKIFKDFAVRRGVRPLVVSISDDVHGVERSVKKYIGRGMAEGLWVLLQNAHNSPPLLLNLESILHENPHPDPTFRCWISTRADTGLVPTRLLQNSVRALIESPKIIKDSLVRTFSWMEPDILKQSGRPEWPAMLHNICYLHSAIRHRLRYGLTGWNMPSDIAEINCKELQESIAFMLSELRDVIMSKSADNSDVARATSWTGIRFMLNEVIYGRQVTHPHDRQTLHAMTDYWISTQATKKEFELNKVKYRLPTSFFIPHVRLNTLIQSLDTTPMHQLDVPEACHMHSNYDTLLGEEQYTLTRINRIYDSFPSSKSLSHQLFARPPTPFLGPAQADISSQSNQPGVCDQGVFSSAVSASLKLRKDTELWEVCHLLLPKVPKSYSKEYIADRIKKIGGYTMFNMFIMRELDMMHALLNDIRNTLTIIKRSMEIDNLGDIISQSVLSCADDLFYQRIPERWCELAGDTAPPYNIGIALWLGELNNRCQHYEKILLLGREKMPAYWLGAFFKPRTLLSLLRQDCIRLYSTERSGQFEQFTFNTEVTSRDKDHLRDPPQEGMFIYGLYLWGCAWDKTTSDLQDAPPKGGYSNIPVIHITCIPTHEKNVLLDSGRAGETFNCPVYASRNCANRDVIFELDVRRENIMGTRWALRGLSATIRPY